MCAYCKASYVADATSSFKLHLKAKHNIVEKRQKTAVEPTEMITGRGGSRERERLKELLVDLITSNNLRFSLLENKDFRDFVLLLNPGIEGMLTDIARELCAQEEQEEEEEAY